MNLTFTRPLGTVYAPWSPSTRHLLDHLPVVRGTCLDLGTGSGILAMHMMQTADRVVATDSNPEAIAYARRQATRNRVRGISWRVGVDYAPVQAMRFDWIIGQPPFLPSAEAEGYAFADGGPTGTETLLHWMDGAPDRLRAQGTALFLGVLPHPWPLRGWTYTPIDAGYGLVRYRKL